MAKEEYFDAGLKAYNNKNYSKAIDYFNELIDKFSNLICEAKLSEIYYMRGICYAQEYSINEALEDFNEAEKLGFDKSKIYCGRGIAYAHDGNNEEAITNFDIAIGLNDRYEEAYYRKGIAYFFDLKFDKAIYNFSKAIELNKYYDKAYYYRGLVYYELKKYDKVIKDFDKAIELDNESILFYNDRGLVYYELKEYDKAIKDFDKAIELDNKSILSYNYRGLVYYALKEYYNAIEDFNKAIELNKEFELAYNNRGMVYLNKSEYDEAIKDFNKAIELNKEFELAYYNRGLVYLNKSEYDEAIKDFNKAIELDDGFTLAYYNMGLAYFYKGEYDKAFNNFKKFDSKIALYYIVELLLKDKKDIDDILKLLNKYTDDYFSFVSNELEKEEKKEFLKIWIYQYILLDLLFINNYKEIEEFSHYTTKNLFEYFIDYNQKEENGQTDNNEYLRLTSISKANDPKEGEILKELLSINAEKNIDIKKEENKDYLVFQTSFIRYTNSLTMFRLYGREKNKEGTGISLVFNHSFFGGLECELTNPAKFINNKEQKEYNSDNSDNSDNEKKKINYLFILYYIMIRIKTSLFIILLIVFMKINE